MPKFECTLKLKRSPSIFTFLVFLATAWVACARAQAGITYVDAVEGASGNTFATGGSPEITTWLNTANTTATDNDQWMLRSTFANGGKIYQSHITDASAFPELTTRVTGLPNGTYTLWAFFWDNVGSSTEKWMISTGLTSGALTSYSNPTDAVPGTTTTGVVNASSLSFTNSPMVTEAPGAGQRDMFGISLGQVVVSTGSFYVFIDRNLLGTASQNRVWYDGVGYEPATPDVTPPTLVQPTSPANGATGVPVNISLSATFNENIALVPGGTITLRDLGPGPDEVIALPDSRVTVFGSKLSITPAAGLVPNNPYAVRISSSAITDLASVPNAFAGIASDGTWSFSTSLAIRIQTDGAWSWFSDHTARFVGGDLYLGYVKGQAKKMAMTRYDFDTGTAYEFLFSTATNPSNDDHDVPNITVLPDGKILSVYSRHNLDPQFYYRTSLNGSPTNLADWGPEQTKALGTAKNTYSNTHRLSAESDKIYNFSRNINFNPTICTSTDHGQTWSAPVHFIKTGTGSVRPYPRYCSNYQNRIDLIYTDGHPRNENNSIYHLFYQGGNFRKSDGSMVKSIANLPLEHDTGERGTVVYPYTTAAWGVGQGPDDWIPSGRAWTWDLHYQPDGKPVCAFQVQVDGAAGPATDFKNDRIYYYYARWDGSQWRRKFIANAGRGLFSTEDDYGGGMCIDPENPNVVYISSNVANPFDLSTLAPALNPNNEIHEIYRGVTADGGSTWAWEAITSGSNASNMRPFVPDDHGRAQAVVWFHGRYTTFINYDCDIYGIFSEPPAAGLRMQHVQWTPGGGAFKWASTPGKSYRIRASLDLMSFPIDVATGISAQGDTTYQPFTFPPAVSSSPRAFFRVEEE